MLNQYLKNNFWTRASLINVMYNQLSIIICNYRDGLSRDSHKSAIMRWFISQAAKRVASVNGGIISIAASSVVWSREYWAISMKRCLRVCAKKTHDRTTAATSRCVTVSRNNDESTFSRNHPPSFTFHISPRELPVSNYFVESIERVSDTTMSHVENCIRKV